MCATVTIPSATTNERVGQPLQQLGNGGLSQRTQHQGADRDPELCRGQHQRQPLPSPDHGTSSRHPTLGHRLQSISPGTDQGELGTDKECVTGE
jgi:hypothetical protein